MKIMKGDAGYIQKKKKVETAKTVFEFGMVAAIFLTGYITTKTRLNLLTVLAILGCLPASRTLVGVLMLLPRKSIEPEKAGEIGKKGASLVKVYDMVLTSYEHIMPVESIVIYGNIVCGYTTNTKADLNATALYLKKNLAKNYYDKVSVKLFTDYKAYIARVEGMENMARVEKETGREHEEGIKSTILSLSM